MDDYRVQLDVYNGPMDLLLYLIRREEIDIYDIPIARLTQQYLAYVELLERIDPETVGEFLVLAATLMEIKSRALLPRPPVEEEGAEEWVDPRMELVRQLLQYKSFKDAARALELSAQLQALRHPRQPLEAQPAGDEIDLEDIEVWHLFEAFQKLLQEIGQGEPFHQVEVDDTPIALYAEDLLDSLQRAGGVQAFDEAFKGRTKAEMIGLFLALLELIRERRVQARQEDPAAAILLFLLDATPIYGAMETHAHTQEPAHPGAGYARPQDWGKGIPDADVDRHEGGAGSTHDDPASAAGEDLLEDDAALSESELDERFRLPETKDPTLDLGGGAGGEVVSEGSSSVESVAAPPQSDVLQPIMARAATDP